MNLIKNTWQWIFSPKLNKIYGGPLEQVYEPTTFEKWGDQMILMLNLVWNLGIYTSPIILGFMYRKGYLIQENIVVFSKCLTTFGVIYAMSLCLRGLGKANNDIYQQFHAVLRNAQNNMSKENKKLLSKYDFDFSAWPVEYRFSEVPNHGHKQKLTIDKSSRSRGLVQNIVTLPCRVIGAVAVYTFGIRVIYPGSLSILQMMLSTALLQGRAKLVEENNGQRYKIKARDDNEIDVMFIDRRPQNSTNSNTLVICCEGNAGFYEIGIMSTPISAGYSVLGWNHPGFACSTGKPYPYYEQNAMEMVMEFAINHLNFNVENIILFGWSIGGYSATWAAMNYPNVKGVILDASFDDILPLAIQHMPAWWESIVVVAIRNHVNLNNFEQLSRFDGPVLLVRRTEDEVICTVEGNISSNRGNFMLVKLLKQRYPNIYGTEQLSLIKEFLSINSSNRDNLPSKYKVDKKLCMSLLQSYVFENSASFPFQIGEELDPDIKNQLALFLAQKYMLDYKSTHCTPLPVDKFKEPFVLTGENDFEYIT